MIGSKLTATVHPRGRGLASLAGIRAPHAGLYKEGMQAHVISDRLYGIPAID